MDDNVFSIRTFYAIFGIFSSSFTAHPLTMLPTRPPTENSPSVLVPYGPCNKATPRWVALNNLNDCLIVLEARSPEAKCHQGQTASDSGEHPSCLSQLLGCCQSLVLLGLQLCHSSLCLSGHMALSLRFPLLIRTQVTWNWGPP